MQEYVIRQAVLSDLDALVAIMEEADRTITKKEWFVADDRNWLAAHLQENAAQESDGTDPGCGFVLAAECCSGGEAECFKEKERSDRLVGFLAVHIPGLSEENLGYDLGWSEEKLLAAAHMESAAVKQAHRGHGLQVRLMQEAEERLRAAGYGYALATVHPDNLASLRSMERTGYQIGATKEKYGGKLRYILWKALA